MRISLLLLVVFVASALAQDPAAPAPVSPTQGKTQREVWGLTVEQYLLVDRSRRPGGDTYEYWKARTVRVADRNGKLLYETKRGPYGNLLERIPGGPIRPVKI